MAAQICEDCGSPDAYQGYSGVLCAVCVETMRWSPLPEMEPAEVDNLWPYTRRG